MSVINQRAMRILLDNAKTVYVYATLPSGEKIVVRVHGMGSKIGGHRMDNGELQEDIKLEWVTSVTAF